MQIGLNASFCLCSFSGVRRPLLTHIPAALQRSLAWQAALLFDWDGEHYHTPTGNVDSSLQPYSKAHWAVL